MAISEVIGNPYPLKQNAGKSFMGSIVLGKGFILSPEEAENLIVKDSRNKDVLFPYLNGDDLNNDIGQKASRWVINFFDWPEEKARNYPDCFEIVERLVKPERQRPNNNMGRQKWWQFYRRGVDLYETISKLDQVMVIAQVSKTLAFAFVPKDQVISMMCIVLSFDDYLTFSLLQNTIHKKWVQKYASALKADTRYTPSDVFETFPFPLFLSAKQKEDLTDIGQRYDLFRKEIMQTIHVGLTKIYNQFHNNQLIQVSTSDESINDKSFEAKYGKHSLWLKKHLQTDCNNILYNTVVEGIEQLRSLHIQMDTIVLNAYGWTDIELKHGFYEIDYLPENDRIRFTIHPNARKEVLKRLLLLNHQIHNNQSAYVSVKGISSKKYAEKQGNVELPF
jgi:hypothetical protein